MNTINPISFHRLQKPQFGNSNPTSDQLRQIYQDELSIIGQQKAAHETAEKSTEAMNDLLETPLFEMSVLEKPRTLSVKDFLSLLHEHGKRNARTIKVIYANFKKEEAFISNVEHILTSNWIGGGRSNVTVEPLSSIYDILDQLEKAELVKIQQDTEHQTFPGAFDQKITLKLTKKGRKFLGFPSRLEAFFKTD